MKIIFENVQSIQLPVFLFSSNVEFRNIKLEKIEEAKYQIGINEAGIFSIIVSDILK